jgi:hypothetical protein
LRLPAEDTSINRLKPIGGDVASSLDQAAWQTVRNTSIFERSAVRHVPVAAVVQRTRGGVVAGVAGCAATEFRLQGAVGRAGARRTGVEPRRDRNPEGIDAAPLFQFLRGKITMKKQSTATLADTLPNWLRKVVVDETGLNVSGGKEIFTNQ